MTLSQLLDTPIMPRGQAPPTQATTTSASPPIIAVTATPTCETKAGQKCPKGSSSNQPFTVPDSENSPPDLGDTQVDAMSASTYIKAFMVDGKALPTSDRVKPWREGHEGKIVECVGKALLLPKDMKH